MTEKVRVKAAPTHFPNTEKMKATDSGFGTTNHQEDLMLIDPDEHKGGSTHTREDHKGIPKAPIRASAKAALLTDKQLPRGGSVNSDTPDPSIGYLEKQVKMPVINTNVSADVEDEADEDNMEDEFNIHSIESDFEDLGEESEEENDEFLEDHQKEIKGELEDDEELEDGEELGIPEDHAAEEMLETEEPEEVESAAEEKFEAEGEDDTMAVVDADEVKEHDEHDLQFATIASAVHVIRSNRIIASIGRSSANKAGIGDIYLTPQYQDVVAANVDAKGLRKGLIQSGFILSKVKLTASKAASKIVASKVEKQLASTLASIDRKSKALEQSLAIAAVGINRKFFKGAENTLKAGLENELVKAGVRGGANLVRAMFAEHGVSYAKAILTLANKISEMPEEVRNQYASALDLTSDEDYEGEDDLEANVDDEEMEDMEDLPTTVSAALYTPLRRDRGALLSAGVKSSSAMAILAGNQSLV